MDGRHTLPETLKHVSTEMSLHVLAYNPKSAFSRFDTVWADYSHC